MASNKPFTVTLAIPASATNLLNPPTLTGGVSIAETKTYAIVRHIRIVNKDTSARTFSLYKGLTGATTAGTEFIGTGLSVPANTAFDWYGSAYFKTADFLVGLASAVTTLVITIEGELGIAD